MVRRFRRDFEENPAVKAGPGDDAAILAWEGISCADSTPELVISTDMLTEGVDFLLERMSPFAIARKSLAVNLSDLAAMCAQPVACVIAVALPKKPRFYRPEICTRAGGGETGNLRHIFRPREKNPAEADVRELMELLYAGFSEIAAAENIPIIGGDTNTWNGGLVISVTVLGRVWPKNLQSGCGGALRRNAAKPGDKILVTGTLGGSILERQFTFQPRVREMLLLNERYSLNAGMDISDGLLLDLWRLTEESECGAVIFEQNIPISPAAVTLSTLRTAESVIYDWIPQDFAAKTPLTHALTDGEDFEILFTAAPDVAERILSENPLNVPITCVGEILSEKGLWMQNAAGVRRKVQPEGFSHD